MPTIGPFPSQRRRAGRSRWPLIVRTLLLRTPIAISDSRPLLIVFQCASPVPGREIEIAASAHPHQQSTYNEGPPGPPSSTSLTREGSNRRHRDSVSCETLARGSAPNRHDEARDSPRSAIAPPIAAVAPTPAHSLRDPILQATLAAWKARREAGRVASPRPTQTTEPLRADDRTDFVEVGLPNSRQLANTDPWSRSSRF